ncbi:MAG: permease [Chloroflexota bacterium]|nr:permease [Chloroflexota bacterium]MDE2951367.1 permease [Chloroflexota bacterium]
MQIDLPRKAFPLPIKRVIFVLLTALVLSASIYQALRAGDDLYLTASVFATRFLGIFIEAVPFLLLGSLTSGLIETFVKTDDILRFLPRSRLGAALGGTLLGLVFPVCECGVVPVTRRLFRKGLPLSMGVAFLLAAPFMNPIVFASTYIAFGFGGVLIGRALLTVLVAVIVATVIGSFADPREVLKPTSAKAGEEHSHHHHPQGGSGLGAKLFSALQIGADDFFEMGRFLILGSGLAALLQTLVPQDSLLALGSGPIMSVLFMQILAFLLSVCSTVDSFLALAFVNTFSTGAIISFLSFGPMVDIKSTLMFTGVFRRKIVFYLVLLPFVLNLLAGVLINVALGY